MPTAADAILPRKKNSSNNMGACNYKTQGDITKSTKPALAFHHIL